jgi:hypothetical protein
MAWKVRRKQRAGTSSSTCDRSDVLIYPVAIAPSSLAAAGRVGSAVGGRVLQARDRKAAEARQWRIARKLRNQYLLGYAKPAATSGWRRIEVRVNRPGLQDSRAPGVFCPGPAGSASVGGPFGV